MINLLPYDNKRQINAARQNVVLIKCLTFFTAALIFLALSCIAASSFIKSSNTGTVKTQPESEEASTTLEQANIIKSNLSLAESIFSQKISYSKIVTSLASALPDGVIMESLSLNKASIGSPIQLIFKAISEAKGQEIKSNFDKSPLFLNTNIISNVPSATNSANYGYTITLKTTINKASSI